MKTLNNYNFKEKKILFRADLNVPVVNGVILEKSRIRSIKSSITKLVERKNKIFLISHFGRPRGKYNKKYSLEFLCPFLAKELGIEKIHFIKTFQSEEIQYFSDHISFGEICLFENLRFYEEEENNDLNFIKKISNHFDIYVNDAFSASHRNHASIVGITNFLPSIAGDSLLKEIKNIDLFLNNSKKPKMAIIGGSKISTKINLLHNLIEYFDNIVVGGAMANTFLFATGFGIGQSLVEKDLLNVVKSIMVKAKNFNCNIILPIDVVCSNSFNDTNKIRYSNVKNILPDQMILDIGNRTTKIISKFILRSKMILWNGPLGAFEYQPFDKATIEIANVIKKNARLLNIITLAGGGDTVAAIKLAKAEEGFSYISNAGGAFLEWLEGKELPGIKALKENQLS